MGVKDLWSVLEPARERRSLDTLRGKTVAVDLGIWVCEMQAAIRNPTVLKPHLRNLFFRIFALLQRQVNVVVVADGKPPELKRRAMLERQKNRYNKVGTVCIAGNDTGETKAVGRSKFASHVKECIELLRLMGVAVLGSDGEAECSCAVMNANGVVDAVITDDNDAFLYGARLVIRNFNLEGKEPEADFYSMDAIERHLHLSRNKLVAMGIFLGSDYCSGGVAGVGKETSLKYLNHFGTEDDDLILPYLKSWNVPGVLDGGNSILFNEISGSNVFAFQKLDKALRAKAAASKELLIDAIADEYKQERTLQSIDISWKKPNLVALEGFLFRHLDWVSTYTVAKVVPLMTLCHLLSSGDTDIMAPQRIVKTRVRNGHLLYEVQWRKLACDVWTEEEFYITLEKKELVEKALPRLLEEYSLLAGTKKSKSKKPADRKKDTKPKKTPTPAVLSEVNENYEDIDIADLSQTLEKSLILIDDDDELQSTQVAATDLPGRLENANVHNDGVQAACTSNEISYKRNHQSEDSPLPLWKRIQLRTTQDFSVDD